MSRILVINTRKVSAIHYMKYCSIEKSEVDGAEDGPEGLKLLESNGTMQFYAISRCQKWMALKSLRKSC